jgi:hypothetical protein
MENKNQTAVEWLVNQVEDFIGLIPVDIIDKAKEMEKEQIKNAYGQGVADEAGEILDSTKDAEEYYNKNYGEE